MTCDDTKTNTKSPIMIAAGKKAALTRKYRVAMKKAAVTAKWANTMTKWLISRTRRGPKWQIVAFAGSGGAESTGVVDLIAIRKDHRKPTLNFRRGDLFELILIQVKGGTADWPTTMDVARLKQVAEHHKARAVVLATWQKGGQPTLYRLVDESDQYTSTATYPWVPVTANEAFGRRAVGT